MRNVNIFLSLFLFIKQVEVNIKHNDIDIVHITGFFCISLFIMYN